MQRKDVIIDLAKLVIAAAWADGELCNNEINALKDLLFRLDEITVEDWTTLTMYMESPPADIEKKEIIKRVAQSLQTKADKTLALETLETLFKCDGKITTEEQNMMDELRNLLDVQSPNIFTSLSNIFKSTIQKRCLKVTSSLLREADSEDYVKNTIYYELKQRSISISKPDAELRKLCLATGLLARIANIDNDIAEEEKAMMSTILAEDWLLSKEESSALVEIGCDRVTKDLDYFRLSHGFFECTDIPERKAFLKTLFKVANAEDKTANDEIEEIRRIAISLKLSHQDFIDAKLTISREDRDGL